MSNKVLKAVSARIREMRINDGYYDGRYSTKSVPNKRIEFLEECDTEFDEYLKDSHKEAFKLSPHRLP